MPYALRAFGAPVWYGRQTLSAPIGVSASSHYQGASTVVPVALPSVFPPSQWYARSGVVLDCQPVICTAPMPQGNIIARGSIFYLMFIDPSIPTQTDLANGKTITFTFLLYGGSTATGQVQMASTLSGDIFQVVCTVVSDIPLTS